MTRTTWPEAADEAGWAATVAADEVRDCPPGPLVGALRALFPTADPRLVRAMTLHVSDRVTRRLRRLNSADHPSAGEHVVAEAHSEVMGAIFDPTSADGREMVDNFWPHVRTRGIDAARTEGRHARPRIPHEVEGDGGSVPPRALQPAGEAGPVGASRLLSRIADPRKRLGFRLAAEGVRVGRSEPCIALACACDPETAAAWMSEVRRILTAEIEA